MGTRSRVGVKNNDGTITSIYVHWDGYLSGVGETLALHYTTQDKIDGLIALGDCSSLHAEITAPKGHTFDNPVNGHTIAYGRDRGEDRVGAKVHAADAWPNSGWEYRYLWDGEWYASCGSRPFEPLADAIARDAAERDAE